MRISILTLAVTALWATNTMAQERYTADRTGNLPIAGARSIHIEGKAGTLTIRGVANAQSVEVTGVARADDRRDLDDIQLLVRRRGGLIEIIADIPDRDSNEWGNRNRALDMTITVPTGILLDVVDGSGILNISGTGAVHLTDGSGQATIENVRGDVTVKDGSGALTISAVTGDVTIDDGSGSIRVEQITGSVRVREDGSGSIRIREVGGGFRVDEKGSGSISHTGVTGTVSIPDRHRRGRHRRDERP